MFREPEDNILLNFRGELVDAGMQRSPRRVTESDHASAETRYKGALSLPTMSDMKICYATAPGYKSFRDVDTGSWYIQIMCEVWSQHAHDTSLDDLLKMVGNTASQLRTEVDKEQNQLQQVCSNEDRGFFKSLYFNPGYYGENPPSRQPNT